MPLANVPVRTGAVPARDALPLCSPSAIASRRRRRSPLARSGRRRAQPRAARPWPCSRARPASRATSGPRRPLAPFHPLVELRAPLSKAAAVGSAGTSSRCRRRRRRARRPTAPPAPAHHAAPPRRGAPASARPPFGSGSRARLLRPLLVRAAQTLGKDVAERVRRRRAWPSACGVCSSVAASEAITSAGSAGS